LLIIHGFGLEVLGFIKMEQKLYEESKITFLEVLELRKKAYCGEMHPEIASSMNQYGQILCMQKNMQEGIKLVDESFEHLEEFFKAQPT